MFILQVAREDVYSTKKSQVYNWSCALLPQMNGRNIYPIVRFLIITTLCAIFECLNREFFPVICIYNSISLLQNASFISNMPQSLSLFPSL